MGPEASSSSVAQPSTVKEKVKDRKQGGSLQTGIGFGCHFWEIPSGRTLGWPVSMERILSGVGWGGEEGQAFWWFPSWVRDPVLGLSVPSSGP